MTTTSSPIFTSERGEAFIYENVPAPHRRYNQSPFDVKIIYADGREEWNNRDLLSYNEAVAEARGKLGIKTDAQIREDKKAAAVDRDRRIRIMQGRGDKDDARAILSQLEGAESELARLRS